MRARVAAGLLLLATASVAAEDPRSQVLLEQVCRNEFARRELTLFANGTLRLRQGEGATREFSLFELGRAELEAYLRRLAEIRFDDLAPSSPGPMGDWVERCGLLLALPDSEPLRFDYDRYDSLPHGLRLVLLVVDDLLAEIEPLGPEGAPRTRALPLETGDLLVRRRDGTHFEVIGHTLEGNGVELRGIEQPVTIYMLKDEVQIEFEAAEEAASETDEP